MALELEAQLPGLDLLLKYNSTQSHISSNTWAAWHLNETNLELASTEHVDKLWMFPIANADKRFNFSGCFVFERSWGTELEVPKAASFLRRTAIDAMNRARGCRWVSPKQSASKSGSYGGMWTGPKLQQRTTQILNSSTVLHFNMERSEEEENSRKLQLCPARGKNKSFWSTGEWPTEIWRDVELIVRRIWIN